ncbi:MAG: sensor histidine kinase [Clostridia bacterium]
MATTPTFRTPSSKTRTVTTSYDKTQCDEERFRLAMEATDDGIWDQNVQTGTVYYSPAYFRMLGYEPVAAGASSVVWQDLIHPDDRDRVLSANLDCVEGRCEQFNHEYRMLARDGHWRWILGRGKCISRDANGRALRLVGTHEDITERKELENRITSLLAEKELILRDVHHRVKNNLSTLRSLLSLQAQSMRGKRAASALQVAAGRVQSIALLYDRLYLSGEYDHLSSLEFVPGLVDQILANFPDSRKIVVLKDIERMDLPQKTVTALSLIINELLTNAMKYAFKGRETGLIRICLRKATDGFSLEIQDDGPGISKHAEVPSGMTTEGLGLTLAVALVDQLQGTMELDTCPGTRIKIAVPLADKAA